MAGGSRWLDSLCKVRIGRGLLPRLHSVETRRSPRTDSMRILCSSPLLHALGTLAALPAAEPTRPLAPTAVTWAEPNAVLGQVTDDCPKQAGVPITVAPSVLEGEIRRRGSRIQTPRSGKALQQTRGRDQDAHRALERRAEGGTRAARQVARRGRDQRFVPRRFAAGRRAGRCSPGHHDPRSSLARSLGTATAGLPHRHARRRSAR